MKKETCYGILYARDIIALADEFCGLDKFVEICNDGITNNDYEQRTFHHGHIVFEKLLAESSKAHSARYSVDIINSTFRWFNIERRFNVDFSILNLRVHKYMESFFWPY